LAAPRLGVGGAFARSFVRVYIQFTIAGDRGAVRIRPAPTVAATVLFFALLAAPAHAGQGAYWGTYVSPRSGTSPLGALTSFESLVGRRFHAYRFYRPIDNGDLGSSVAAAMRRRGQPIYLNITAQVRGRCVAWRSVTAGRYDRRFRVIASAVRRYRYRVYFSWNHEMENTCRTGTPADYRASYKHIRRVFRREHVTNARWVVVFAASYFGEHPAGVRRFLPKRYDMIGVDGYNRAGEWRTPAQIFGAAHHFAAKRGARLFIGEIGCEERPSDATAKAAWITSAADTFQRWNVGAVLWTNSPTDAGDYRADSSQRALTAYRQAGDRAFFGR
jgi:hypothetical protein